jgi:hypothetical protein
MTTIAKLLAQKQLLLERLQEDPGPHVREEIERLLAEIDAELNQLDEMAGRDAIGVQIITDAFKAGGGAGLTAVDPGPGLLATCVVFHGPHVRITNRQLKLSW